MNEILFKKETKTKQKKIKFNNFDLENCEQMWTIKFLCV